MEAATLAAKEASERRCGLAATHEAASGVHWVANPLELMRALGDGGVMPAGAVFAVRVVEYVSRTGAKHVHLCALRPPDQRGFLVPCQAATVCDVVEDGTEANVITANAAAAEAWVRRLVEAATPCHPLFIEARLRNAPGARILATDTDRAFGEFGFALPDRFAVDEVLTAAKRRVRWTLLSPPGIVVAQPLHALATAPGDAACLLRCVTYTGLYYAEFGVARHKRDTGVVSYEWHRSVTHPTFRKWRDTTLDALVNAYPAGCVFVHDVLAASPVVAFTVGPGSDNVLPWQATLPASGSVGGR